MNNYLFQGHVIFVTAVLVPLLVCSSYYLHYISILRKSCTSFKSIDKAKSENVKEGPFLISCLLYNILSIPFSFILRRRIVKLLDTAWKVSKYGGFFYPYFPVFGLNTEPYSVRIQENTDKKKLRIWTLFTQCDW